jgi:hypothetical protein
MRTTELTADEKALLAREVAADEHDRHWPHVTSYGELPRESFLRGWDAAMEYAVKMTAEDIAHLDSDECCHFQD